MSIDNGSFYEENKDYIYLVGHRVRFQKSTNIFQLVDGEKVYYQIYPSELTQMIEIFAKEKQIEMVMVFADKERNGNQGTLQLMPKMKWIA